MGNIDLCKCKYKCVSICHGFTVERVWFVCLFKCYCTLHRIEFKCFWNIFNYKLDIKNYPQTDLLLYYLFFFSSNDKTIVIVTCITFLLVIPVCSLWSVFYSGHRPLWIVWIQICCCWNKIVITVVRGSLQKRWIIIGLLSSF